MINILTTKCIFATIFTPAHAHALQHGIQAKASSDNGFRN